MNQQQSVQSNGAVAGSSGLVKRFAFTPHRNPRIRRLFPDEIEVGWHFTDAAGKTCFVQWGATENRDSLARLIVEVQQKHGPVDVVEFPEMVADLCV